MIKVWKNGEEVKLNIFEGNVFNVKNQLDLLKIGEKINIDFISEKTGKTKIVYEVGEKDFKETVWKEGKQLDVSYSGWDTLSEAQSICNNQYITSSNKLDIEVTRLK